MGISIMTKKIETHNPTISLLILFLTTIYSGGNFLRVFNSYYSAIRSIDTLLFNISILFKLIISKILLLLISYKYPIM